MRVRPLVWLTMDSRAIKVSEMSDEHLKNAIAKVERETNPWRFQWLPRLYLERSIRRLKNQPLSRVKRYDGEEKDNLRPLEEIEPEVQIHCDYDT